MNIKTFNIFFNKNIKAPKLCWRTSSIGANINYLVNSIKDTIHPTKIGKEFQKVLNNKPNEENLQRVCNLFEKETGIKLIPTSQNDLYCFSNFANVLLRDIKKGYFPKDIKFVMFGHGSGSSLISEGKDAWHVAANPNIKIFNLIEEKIPKGQKVLVNCCEETPKHLKHLIPKDKPAIGYPTYTEATSSYYHPLKIVQSGKREIIGGYANGFTTLY